MYDDDISVRRGVVDKLSVAQIVQQHTNYHFLFRVADS